MPGPNPHVKSKIIGGERMWWYGDARQKGCDVARTEDRAAVDAAWDRIYTADCVVCGKRSLKRAMVRVSDEPRGGTWICAWCDGIGGARLIPTLVKIAEIEATARAAEDAP